MGGEGRGREGEGATTCRPPPSDMSRRLPLARELPLPRPLVPAAVHHQLRPPSRAPAAPTAHRPPDPQPLIRSLGPAADPANLKPAMNAAALWAGYAAYLGVVMLSPLPPGPPAYATPAPVLAEALDESVNIFWIKCALGLTSGQSQQSKPAVKAARPAPRPARNQRACAAGRPAPRAAKGALVKALQPGPSPPRPPARPPPDPPPPPLSLLPPRARAARRCATCTCRPSRSRRTTPCQRCAAMRGARVCVWGGGGGGWGVV
jgi:hypothetical protein